MGKKQGSYTIYALVDPRNDIPYYVGMSRNAYSRYGQHIAEDSSNKTKNQWIKELKSKNMLPALQLIETGIESQEARTRELYWIKQYKQAGHPLTNRVQHREAIGKYLPGALAEARIDAMLTIAALAREARVARQVIERAERGKPITPVKARAIVNALNRVTGKAYTEESLGLVISMAL